MAASCAGWQIQVENPHRAAVESVIVEGESATASLRAGVLPGETKLRVTAPGFTPQEITLQTTPRRRRRDRRRHT